MSTDNFANASRSWCRDYDRRELLRVRLTLATPVSYVEPINLDSVLAALLTQRIGCWSQALVDPSALDDITLPLARATIAGHPVWEATRLWPVGAEGHEVIRYRKRPPEPELLEWGTKASLRFKQGPFRAYDLPLLVHAVPALEAVAHGDARGIRRLLHRLRHVGKKGAQGYGLVSQVDVTVADDLDAFPWTLPDGRPTRPIPHADGVAMGFRPPYWHRPWWAPCMS